MRFSVLLTLALLSACGNGLSPRPLVTDEFAPPYDAEKLSGTFTGTLQLDAAQATGFDVHYDRFAYMESAGAQLEIFPAVSFGWVQHDGYVIPADQGVMRVTHPYWEIAFQAGRTWTLASDPGVVRMSMPFALIERNANCTHNGVLTWTVNADGEASRADYEIASETCPYFKFDMWGNLPASSAGSADINQDAIVAAFEKNRNARLPIEPVEALAKAYPAVDAGKLGAVANMHPADTSVYGFVVDGRHYRSDCKTRNGDYPFCTEMLLPSYSTAKSIFAGLALMRLEALIPGASQAKINDLVPECRVAGWADITLEHALDMATGRYRSTVLEADEVLDAHVEFIYAENHAEKIKFACEYFPQKAKPGTVMAYHSSDTYLLGVAMRALLDEKGMDADDIYASLVVEPVWKPLALSEVIGATRKTYDAFAQPLVGWGLSYQVDDIARIGQWLVSGAPPQDKTGIDRRLYQSAMQQDDRDRGLDVGSPTLRYNNGFWALDIAEFIGCRNAVWVPFMSGFGGISVVLFPNETVYYMVADGYIHRWREAAIESNKIRNMCQ